MEYRVMKGEIPVCETILDTSAEQPIDLDFSLPDYCPDIQKILKCQILPHHHGANDFRPAGR